MHISEGVLSAPVLIAGGGLTAIGAVVGLKKLDMDDIPKTGLLSAVFFVAALIHVPFGPGSAHLVMNSLMGILLGWVAFPAILVGLLLQAVFFQFGGLTTLGVNTFNLAFPAVISYYVFRPFIRSQSALGWVAAFLCGAGAILLSAVGVAVALILTEENFLEVAGLIMVANLPVMVIEGVIIMFCVSFLKKAKPSILPGYVDTE